MQILTLTATLLVLTVIGFYFGRGRALATASGRLRNLHSLPSYYGYYVALWCALPALLILTAWVVGEQQIVRSLLVSSLPEAARSLPPDRLDLLLNDIRNVGSGNGSNESVDPGLRQAADRYAHLLRISRLAMTMIA